MTASENWTSSANLGTQGLLPADGEEEFLLHLAALEWSLADPIIIERTEDIKSRGSWQERLEPYRHQMQNLMTFCRRLPVTLIADDVGLGKTISAGLVLSELIVRRRVSRALVVCPSILGPQWIEELESKFGIFGRWATGGELDAELRRDAPVVATTYESVSPRLQKIEPGLFDMLILDEAHKLRNLYGSQKPPKMAERMHKALKQRLFKYVLMLTATPIQNRLWDLYTLVDCLVVAKGHANPFGDHGAFRRNFIADASTGARTLKPGKAAEFRRILRQYLVRTRRQEVRLLFPKREVRLYRVKPNSVDIQLQKIVADNIQRVPGFMQVSLARALMSSPQALVAQLHNMAENNSEWQRIAHEVQGIVDSSRSQPSKVQGLFRIIEQLRKERKDTWRLVIFTIRRETQRVIGEALSAQGIEFGVIQGGSPAKNVATVKAFTSNPPKVNVIVSTDAGAEGVNLQAGNVLINFDLPWNPMIVEQRIGRIQRLASIHRHVLVVNLAVADSPEERVVARLMQKLQTIVDTVGDIEAILEASGDDADQGESSFEAQIRDMVLKSLAGQDVGEAAKLAEQSIQEAKELFEKHQVEMDATLGDLNELHEAGPSMPRLTPVLPSVGYQDFVKRALTEEGFQLSPSDTGMLQAKKDGRPPELISFDEDQWREHTRAGVFMGKAPMLYLPGKPAFERLVQRWLDRGGHYVSDLRQQTEGRARDLFQRWLSRIDGAELTSVEAVDRQVCFQGRTRCKITASNSLDSYEKLLDVQQVPDGHSNIFTAATDALSVAPEELDPISVVPGLKPAIQRTVENDEDMTAFCEFYGARLNEELSKAAWEVSARKKVESDLRPAMHAHAVALTGILYESAHFRANFAIDGHDGYSADFHACPVTGQLLSQPEEWAKCAETRKTVPVECLDTCEVSKQRVLRHLLVISDETGRKALYKYSVKCEISGRIALTDEFAKSDLSGQEAVASAFRVSPVEGRRGLPGEFAKCAFTGVEVLRDELLESEVSRKPYRRDESESSAVSGLKGHRSEFVTCALTGDVILASEGERSELSGRFVRKDKSKRSGVPPHRLGAVDEFVACARTSVTLLRDEAGTCAVTGQTVAKTLLAPSDLSGRLALVETLVQCEVTGKKLLPGEVVVSEVSGKHVCPDVAYKSPISGLYALREECCTCDITGILALPDELLNSDASGARFRRDQSAISEESNRVGHRSESTKCEFSGRLLLCDEIGHSDLSGKTASLRDLLRSEKSGRVGHRSEMVKCASSGKLLLTDEAKRSEVSGLVVDKDLLVRSARSGRLALPQETIRCSVTNLILLPGECSTCMATGKLVDQRLLQASELSGAWALPDKMLTCPVTGKRGIPQEFVKCDLTGDLVAPAGIQTCVATGKRGRRDKMVRSVVSGRWLTPAAAVRSIINKQPICPDEGVYCLWNEGYLLPIQTAKCKRTGLVMQRELLSEAGEFTFLRQLLNGQLQMGDASDLVKWLRTQRDGKLMDLRRAWSVSSPRGGVRLVFAELHNWLGLNLRYAGIIVRVRPELEVIGDITSNCAEAPGWKKL